MSCCGCSNNPQVSGLFNVGSGQGAQLARSGHRAVQRLPAPGTASSSSTCRRRCIDKYQYFTEARMERLRAAGYARPFTTLEAGIADYVRSYLLRADPYR